MDVLQSWKNLNARMADENAAAIPGLFQVHMGVFDDLRKNGHRITVDGQRASVLASALRPEERLALACRIGRDLIEAQTGIVNGGFAEICAVQQADFFPHCVTMALGAMLEEMRPGPSGMKMTVLCSYETFMGNDDPLAAVLPALAPCFPWAAFQLDAARRAPPQTAVKMISLDRQGTLFRADRVTRVDVARTAFSGSVIRGEIRQGDLLQVTDEAGRELCPPGNVLAIYLKDRVEAGKVLSEKAESLLPGRHADSLLAAVDLPQGTGQGILLTKEDPPREIPEKPAAKADPADAPEKPSPAEKPAGRGFLARLFGRQKE